MNSFQPLKAKFLDRDHCGSIANTPWNTNMAMGKSTRTKDASLEQVPIPLPALKCFICRGLVVVSQDQLPPVCELEGSSKLSSCYLRSQPWVHSCWIYGSTSTQVTIQLPPIYIYIKCLRNQSMTMTTTTVAKALQFQIGYIYIYVYTFGTSEYKKVFLPGELLTINHPIPFFGMENRPGIVHVFIQRGAKRADIAQPRRLSPRVIG